MYKAQSEEAYLEATGPSETLAAVLTLILGRRLFRPYESGWDDRAGARVRLSHRPRVVVTWRRGSGGRSGWVVLVLWRWRGRGEGVLCRSEGGFVRGAARRGRSRSHRVVL